MKATKVQGAKAFLLLGLATEMKLLSAIDEGWGFTRESANRWRFFGLRVQLVVMRER